MDLNAILAAIGAHNWLALLLLAAVYARKLAGPDSKFPVSIPVNWLPVVTGAFGLVIVVITARMAGQAWGAAALAGAEAGVATGFVDGLLHAIFADPSKAPAWAKALVFLVDDILGGGGMSVKRTQTTETVVKLAPPPANDAPPPPKASARLGLLGAAALAGILLVLTLSPRATQRAQEDASVDVIAAVPQADGRTVLLEGRFDPGSPIVLEGCSSGQINPQILNVTADSLVLLSCMIPVYANDTSTQPVDWVKLSLDLANHCGADVANIVNVFGATSAVAQAAQKNAGKVHPAAIAAQARISAERAAQQVTPAPGG